MQVLVCLFVLATHFLQDSWEKTVTCPRQHTISGVSQAALHFPTALFFLPLVTPGASVHVILLSRSCFWFPSQGLQSV